MSKLSILLPALLLFLTSMIPQADAQRRGETTYQSLLQRADQPAAYIDHILLPGEDDESQIFVTFRLDYDFIPFLKSRPNMKPPTPEAQYFAPVRMGVEIFEGDAPRSGRKSSDALSVFRENWQDTVWVDTFEQTKSRYDYTQGYVSTTLEPGEYHYELQLSRAGSVREQSSNRRNFSLPNFSDTDSTSFILLDHFDISDEKFSGTLLNYGNEVLYGQDYSLLFKVPDSEDSFTLSLQQLSVGSENRDTVLTKKLTEQDFIFVDSFDLNSSETTDLTLNGTISQNGHRFAVVNIPNQNFENASYRIVLHEDGKEKPVDTRRVNSQWLDMPVSLYNLDIAIEMMKFIVDESQLNRLRSGSTAEKEKKFREFWNQRDPSPNTEFNELMAEYYNRIDYAYKNFSSLQTPGFETDQGRAYILYGPPENIERRLPADAPTREVWEYNNRTLIFEATTGFGDFRLISQS
ncbi:MAG TPA: GWxTD domain-containing protein [Balneolaceae bacterium]|nr:GWxTD domain-containing protein [Balneolaceae bacterium]